MEESKSPPSELGLQNCYYSSTRKDAAERAVMADLAHSAEALQDRSLPNLPPVRRLGREYGLGNSSSRSWVWAHFAVGAKHDALRVLGTVRSPAARPRPREAEWAYGDSGVRTGVRI